MGPGSAVQRGIEPRAVGPHGKPCMRLLWTQGSPGSTTALEAPQRPHEPPFRTVAFQLHEVHLLSSPAHAGGIPESPEDLFMGQDLQLNMPWP